HYTILAKEGKGANARFYIYDAHREAVDVTVKGNISVPKGTRIVTLNEKTGGFAEGTPAAVTGSDGGKLVLTVDDKAAKGPITVEADKVRDTDPKKIEDGLWKGKGERRLGPKEEETNVHTSAPKPDEAKHASGNAESASAQPAHKEEEKEYELQAADIND